MRQGASTRRSRNRSGNNGGGNRGKQQIPVRLQTFDSNGPDVRIRGSALQVLEKYQTLARDAQSSGDRVLAENLLQHAEHYYRILNIDGNAPASHQNGRVGRHNSQRNGNQGHGNHQTMASGQNSVGNNAISPAATAAGEAVVTSNVVQAGPGEAVSPFVTVDLSPQTHTDMAAQQAGDHGTLGQGDGLQEVDGNVMTTTEGEDTQLDLLPPEDSDGATARSSDPDDATAPPPRSRVRRAPRRRVSSRNTNSNTGEAETADASGETEAPKRVRRTASPRRAPRKTSTSSAAATQAPAPENGEEAAAETKPKRSPRSSTGRTRRTAASKEKPSADLEVVADESAA